MDGSLEVVAGVRSWTLAPGAAATIGREGDFVIANPGVSRRHAYIHFDGGWWIRDQGSTAGLWVGGAPQLGAVRVAEETTVHLGDPALGAPAVVLRPHAAHDAAGSPPAPGSPGAELLREATLGRAQSNSVVVDDPLVSRSHAAVITDGERLWVRDEHSRNGTFLDGVRVVGTVGCRPGARLTLGNHDFRVALGDGSPALVPFADGPGLSLEDVSFRVGAGRRAKELLREVAFDAPHGRLVAVIGPTGAGKSTLMAVLTGQTAPSDGRATFDGLDIAAQFAALRTRIGFVPQEDIIHRTLPLRVALDYAARLRLPPDTTAAERRGRVDGVLTGLGLTEHARTAVDRLSGGQRKRASVALELLTEPAMLVLDEPTSGLDPSMDAQVMALLRGLADSGRVVVVVTHSTENLGVCDAVLVLARGGMPAYEGRPDMALGHFGAPAWRDVFERAAREPELLHDRFRAERTAQRPRSSRTTAAAALAPSASPPSASPPLRQYSALVGRQLRLMAADRGYTAFLAVLPFVLGALALVVPGDTGFGTPEPPRLGEPSQLLVLLVVGAAIMGMAQTARDLVGEREIFRREKSVGLRPGAYILAKLTVAAALCCVQAAIMVAIVRLGKPGPEHHLFTDVPGAELWAAVALTAVSSAALGLAASAWVKTSEQVMPALVVGIMAQLVLAGGLIPVTGRAVLEQVSWIAPARWGFSLGAESIDLRGIVPSSEADWLWEPVPERAALAAGALLAITAVTVVLAWIRLARLPRSTR